MDAKISIVIPTRNRTESLNRLLSSIEKQTLTPEEVIVVDASDPGKKDRLVDTCFPLKVLTSRPSVCAQRNLGIREAKGEYILLCDDDIVLPENYLATTRQFLNSNPNEGAVTGIWLQKDAHDQWVSYYPILSLKKLFFAWFFGHSIWGPIDLKGVSGLWSPLYGRLKKVFKEKKNSLARSGWPQNTEFDAEVVKVAVTSLGSALVRKSWFEIAQFDEALDAHGYGDNYGVCVQFPGDRPVNVLTSLKVEHYHSSVNRNKALHATYRRTLALSYFISKKGHRIPGRKLFFLWSVFGHSLAGLVSFNFPLAWVYIKVFFVAAANKTIFLQAENDK
ncbi:MAG: hypothetical protein Roseis3KO_01780 [Roseivirga sp.]